MNVQGDWKIVWDEAEGDDAHWMLFNIADDPGERRDLGPGMTGKLDEMIELWSRYEQDSGVIYVD